MKPGDTLNEQPIELAGEVEDAGALSGVTANRAG
jgi:hypothetical protein